MVFYAKRRTFKRRSFKKRKSYGKKRASTKRRYVGHKRARANYRIHNYRPKYVPVGASTPSIALTKLVMTDSVVSWPPTIAGVQWHASSTLVDIGQQLWISANDIFNAGRLTTAYSVNFPPASGVTEMKSKYTQLQVVKCKLSVTIDCEDSLALAATGNPFILVPFSASNVSTLSGTQTWDEMLKQPGCRHAYARVVGDARPQLHMHSTIDISKNEGIPGTSINPDFWQSTGGGQPAQTPGWALMAIAPVASPAPTTSYTIFVKMTWYVKWFNVNVRPLSLETKVIEEKKEGKEEKKDDDDEEDMSMYKGVSTLSLSSPVPSTPTSLSLTPHTCLNPLHPKIGHERVSTCV